MCGGGTTPILGRSGVPAISRPPPGGGVGNVMEKAKGGGDIFWNTVGALGVIDLRFRNLTLTISPF